MWLNGSIQLPKLAADPISPTPVVGQAYFNTTYGIVKTYDGTFWSDSISAAGFSYVPAGEVVVVPPNRVCTTYWHSKTDGRVIIKGIVSTGGNGW